MILALMILIIYTVFFIWVPCCVLFKYLDFDKSLTRVIGPWLAIFLHVLFFEISILLGFRDIGVWLYPLFFLFIAVVQLPRLQNLEFGCGFKHCVSRLSTPLAILILYSLLLVYWLVGRRQMLPADGQPALIWLDLAYFSGLISSLKEYVLAKDYHVFGSLTRYHFFCYQWAAAISSTFKVDSLSVITFFVPAALISYLNFSSYYLFRMLGFGKWLAALVALCCLFTSSFGALSSFVSGVDTAFNLFASPSLLMSIGFCISILALMHYKVTSGIFWYNCILFAFSFALIGSKISTGFIVLLGCGIFDLVSLKRNAWKNKVISLSFMAVASCAAYLFYFFEEHPFVISNMKTRIPSPLFYSLNPFPNHLQASTGASLLGLFYRYWPWWLLFFATFVWNQKINSEFRKLTAICGVIGIVASFALDLGGNEGHFYHIGLLCILLAVSSSFIAGFEKWPAGVSGILICIIMGCVFPIWGNGFIPYFGGYEADGSTPIIRAKELDGNSYQAYVFIKMNSSAKDLVLTPQDRVESSSWGKNSYNFFASAITERQVFLEGWGFSKFNTRSPDQEDYIFELTALRDSLYLQNDRVKAEHALMQIKPQWIVWDQRISGEVPLWLQECLSKKKSFGPIIVLQTNFSIHGGDAIACERSR